MSKRKKNRNRDNNVEYHKKDYSKYYFWIIKAGIIACLFLPLFIVHSHLFAMQVGKVLAFRIIVEIIVFFYIILIINRKEYRPKWGQFELSITFFIVVYFLTSLAGANFLRSFWGTAERMGGFFTLLHFWAYFVILISIFKTKKEWNLLFGVSLFAAVISSAYALIQSAFFWRTVLPWIELKNIDLYTEIKKFVTEDNFMTIDNLRPFGTIGNAGLFTAYILYNIFLSLYLLLGKNDAVRMVDEVYGELLDSPHKVDRLKNNRRMLNLFGISKEISRKILIFASVLFIFVTIFVAGSRSSFLAVIAGLFVLIFIYLISSSKRKVQRFSAILIIALVLGGGYVYMNKKEEWVKNNYILARLTNISIEGEETRTMTWESSLKGFMDKPIAGVGPENYNIVFNKYFNPLHFTGYGSDSWYDRAHNIFLDILTTMGILGLVSYLGIFGAIYWFLIKNRGKARENLPAFTLIASFPVAYFVQDMFWFDDFSTYLMLFLFFAFASSYFNNELGFDNNIEKGKKITGSISKMLDLENMGYKISRNRRFFETAIAISLILTIYYTNVRAWKFHDLTTIAVAAFTQNSEDSFYWYKEAMANSTYLGRQELYKRFGNYANADYKFPANGDPGQEGVFRSNLKFAILEMENAISENRQDVQFYSLLGGLCNKYYSSFREEEYLDKAEKTLQRAIELSPDREILYFEYGQTMVFKKDYQRAIELFKKGVDLNPSVPVSHWYLGVAYSYTKEYNLADSEISEAIRLGYEYKTVRDILNIVPIYIELKNYRRLESLYLDVLYLDPKRADIYISLALVYKELGDNIKAAEMANKAITLDESLRSAGEKFIKELGSSI